MVFECVWQEHVIFRLHVELEVHLRDFQVNVWHRVIVSIVAIARVSFVHARVLTEFIIICLVRLGNKQVASVSLNHERVGEVIVEKVWQ